MTMEALDAIAAQGDDFHARARKGLGGRAIVGGGIEHHNVRSRCKNGFDLGLDAIAQRPQQLGLGRKLVVVRTAHELTLHAKRKQHFGGRGIERDHTRVGRNRCNGCAKVVE